MHHFVWRWHLVDVVALHLDRHTGAIWVMEGDTLVARGHVDDRAPVVLPGGGKLDVRSGGWLPSPLLEAYGYPIRSSATPARAAIVWLTLLMLDVLGLYVDVWGYRRTTSWSFGWQDGSEEVPWFALEIPFWVLDSVDIGVLVLGLLAYAFLGTAARLAVNGWLVASSAPLVPISLALSLPGPLIWTVVGAVGLVAAVRDLRAWRVLEHADSSGASGAAPRSRVPDPENPFEPPDDR